jgi:uncharacterized integral membrane protein
MLASRRAWLVYWPLFFERVGEILESVLGVVGLRCWFRVVTLPSPGGVERKLRRVAMRWILSIVGILLALLGGLWILQGTDVIRSGFMAGQMQYTILGIVVAIVGVGLLVLANRRQKGTPSAG